MRTLLALAIACQIFPVHGQSASRDQADRNGRFQLFQGEYEFVNIKGESFRNRGLFKIDTATGALLICEGNQIDGKYLSPPQFGKLVQRHYCRPFEGELVIPLTEPTGVSK